MTGSTLGVALPDQSGRASARRGASSPFQARARAYAVGLALVTGIGLLALVAEEAERRLSGGVSAPVEALVLAILLGVLVRNTVGLPAAAGPGVAFAAKPLLEGAVFLLGASVNFAQLFQAGPRVLLLILLCVALALVVGTAVSRLIGLRPKLAILVAVGNAICGNSAIVAVAPAIKAEKEDVTLSIALTAVVGVALVLALPALVPLLQLSHYQYGVLVGTTVYAVPQVVAASFPVGADAGDVATFVKLLRVLLLGPVVLVFSLLFAGRRESATAGGWLVWRTAMMIPWFVAGFLLLAALNSLGLFAAVGHATGLGAQAIAAEAKTVSKLLMLLSMGALGLGVEFAVVKRVGPRVFAAVLASATFLVALSLTLLFALQV